MRPISSRGRREGDPVGETGLGSQCLGEDAMDILTTRTPSFPPAMCILQATTRDLSTSFFSENPPPGSAPISKHSICVNPTCSEQHRKQIFVLHRSSRCAFMADEGLEEPQLTAKGAAEDDTVLSGITSYHITPHHMACK